MIPAEALVGVRKIVSHGGCPDGMASAMILRDAFPDAEIKLLEYGTKALATLPAEPGMIFCDITPPRERAREFVDAGAVVLDHHRHAKDIVEMFGERGVFGDEQSDPGVSGAVLAYDVWDRTVSRAAATDMAVERFAVMAGIRDTFRKQSRLWDEACAQADALTFYPPEHFLSDGHRPWLTEDESRVGRLVRDHNRAAAHRLARGAHLVDISGSVRLAIIQGRETSDAAEILRERGCHVCAGFEYKTEDSLLKCTWSLRSDGSVDVGAFCKEQGGGGHTRAAGFTEIARTAMPQLRISTLLVDHLARLRAGGA